MLSDILTPRSTWLNWRRFQIYFRRNFDITTFPLRSAEKWPLRNWQTQWWREKVSDSCTHWTLQSRRKVKNLRGPALKELEKFDRLVNPHYRHLLNFAVNVDIEDPANIKTAKILTHTSACSQARLPASKSNIRLKNYQHWRYAYFCLFIINGIRSR